MVAEVRNLVAEGVREINLISQDTTYFGMDLWKEKAGPRQPGGLVARSDAGSLARRAGDDSKESSGFGCFTRTPRIGAKSSSRP